MSALLLPKSRAALLRRTVMLALAGVFCATAIGLSRAATADAVLAIVNGTEVHESDLRLVDETIGRNLPTQDKVERRAALLDMLIDTILLSKVAQDQKISDEADLQRRVTYARNYGLMQHLLATTGQRAKTEDAIRKAYDEVVVKAANEPELHLRHIFFKVSDFKDEGAVKAAEAKANDALARINGGEDFAAVVKDMSEDDSTKANGGDFGWRTRVEMGGEYAGIGFNLKNGEVSPIIKTAFGFHIIKLEDRRTRQPVAYEKIHDRVAAMVANAAQIELVDKVRAGAKIVRMDQAEAAPNKDAQTSK